MIIFKGLRVIENPWFVNINTKRIIKINMERDYAEN